MRKAHDRIEWNFLEKVLLKFNFAPDWIARIMQCVRSVQFSIIIGGSPCASFNPSCGLHQRDPLSSYLFIIALEVLSRMISNDEELGHIKGIRLARSCPSITHLLFADDSLFFLEVNSNLVADLKSILDRYCKASDRCINSEKSSLFFSSNSNREIVQYVLSALHFFYCARLGEVFGHPFNLGKI